MNADSARFIVGVVGNVISACLFLSPSPTFYRIIKNKSVEEFKVDPYVAAVLNCVFWVIYGVVTPNSILVVTINGAGLVLELIYIAIYIIYAQRNGKKRVTILLGTVVVIIAAVAIPVLRACHSSSKRSLVIGVVADIFNIIMYASPLTVMRKVIKTKSVEYMPFWLSLTNFLNAAVWTAYALIELDIFILISNGLGTVFGLMQLVLYACYWKSTPKEEEKPKGNSQAQLTSGIDNV